MTNGRKRETQTAHSLNEYPRAEPVSPTRCWRWRSCGWLSARPAFHRRSRGMTLLELILVLSILVAVGAIVAPSVGDAFKRHRLIASADRLRNVWDRARLTAMKTGQIQVFRCTIGESSYSITPFMTGEDMNSASAGATMLTSAGTVAQADKFGTMSMPVAEAPADPEQADESDSSQSLEEGIIFVSCVVGSDMRSYSLAQQQGGMTGVTEANQSVMFYPDGSTSTAEVIIQTPNGKQKGVRMRGLTGATQVLIPGELPAEIAP